MHLVPSPSCGVGPETPQDIIICVSHRARSSVQLRPERQLVRRILARLPATSLEVALGHLLFFISPPFSLDRRAEKYCAIANAASLCPHILKHLSALQAFETLQVSLLYVR